ncbi:MAG: hypothetical protein JXB10_15645 [Pirellulales bacterium]|nr:hypothetical protein [Pirellulales bacterium]
MFLLVLPLAAPLSADPPREIFVPYGDLHVLLEQQPQRVLLKREEFDALVKKAQKTPEKHAPQSAVLLAAAYEGQLRDQRAEIAGRLTIDVLEEGLHAVPLDVYGVGLRHATLDGKPAALGCSEKGPLLLFVEGRGRHELRLEMVAPVEILAAQQALCYRLPRPAAATLVLDVAGDVEVKSGAAVIRRTVRSDGSRTHFELLPREGDTTLVLSLNSRRQRQKAAVVARSVVLIDEVAAACEKLHATVLLEILHRAIDQVRLAAPEGFEITEVASPLLTRWEVHEEGGRKIITIKLREPTADPVTLRLSALRTSVPLDAWQAPRLEVLDMVAQASILGLLVDEGLKPESLSAEGLIAIDTDVLTPVLPADALSPAQGASPLRTVAAYYAPQSRYTLGAKFVKPAAELAVNTSLLWRIGQRQQELLGGLTLLPLGEKRFTFDFRLPADWTVTGVTSADGKPLRFERYPAGDQTARFRVYLPQGMAADRECKVNFRAVRTPPDWLGDWKTQTQDFPGFEVLGATRAEGAVAVSARDDITARPEKLRELTPLDAAEKVRYGLENVAVDLAYRYENPSYAATIRFERTPPRITARSLAFLNLEAERLSAHYEVNYTIDEAQTQTLSLLLPADTPTALQIRGLDGVDIKETEPAEKGNMRQWNVLLAAPRRGKVRLAVDFEQPLPEKELQNVALPLIAADGVEYESGILAVEGSAEFETKVKTDARKVDVGELAEADYQPGRRLLGAWGFAGKPPAVNVSMTRKPEYLLSRAIVLRAALRTRLSPEGESLTQANFTIRSKALYVQLQLPVSAELWSVQIDGAPIKPQREGDHLLLGLPTAAENAVHDLQFVYRMPTPSFALRGTVELPAPRLFLLADRGAKPDEVPLADLEWTLAVPGGYTVVRTGGTLATDELHRPVPAALQVAGALYYLTGGVGNFGCAQVLTLPARRAKSVSYLSFKGSFKGEEGAEPAACEPAPESATATAESTTSPYYLQDDVQKFPEGRLKSERELTTTITGTVAPKVEVPQEGKPGRIAAGAYSADLDVGFGVKASAPATPGLGSGLPQAPKVKGFQLLGQRSLKIDLEPPVGGRVMTFRSLGADPVLLKVELADTERFDALGWAVALGAFLIGAVLTCRSCRVKTWYVVACLALATLIPILWDCTATADVCNMLFFAAAWLIPYYLAAALVRKLTACCRTSGWCCSKPAATAGLLLAMLLLSGHSMLGAQEAKADDNQIQVQVVAPAPPVKMPEDAVVIPYDPDEFDGLKGADKLLVPYKKYVELWNRAYPDQKLETSKPPADYALAGAAYQTTLEGDENLLVTGQIEIDVFSGDFVQIPLGLGGGVLARAELDGRPARLRLLTSPLPPGEGKGEGGILKINEGSRASQINRPHPNPLPKGEGTAPPVMLLTISGKGRHKLELAVRMKLSREGGWRVAGGNLPAAPAAALTVTVPLAETEVRLLNLPDRPGYDTKKPGQTIVTALGAAGRFGVRWRPKVAEGQVDRGLNARSEAVLDVQEDGLRLSWRLTLDFRGTPQEEFSVKVPPQYLVEKVEGDNVRGWETVEKERGRVVRVNLLKAAKGKEQVVLRLRQTAAGPHPNPLPKGEGTEVSAPLVTLPQAALHTGRITLRRSPLLDVRTTRHPGLIRCDVPGDLSALVGPDDTGSPLGAQPFEAYQFDRDPGNLVFQVTPLTPRLTAEVQTVFALSEYARKLESRIRCRVQDRPLFRLRIALPEDFRLDRLSVPGEFQYLLTDAEKGRLLTIYFAAPHAGNFDVIVSGTLVARSAPAQESTLAQVVVPRVEVLDAVRQEGDVAMLVDAEYDYDGAELKNCQSVLLDRVRGWLKPEQFALTRAAVHYRQGDYAATLKFRPRTPEVRCNTVSNVRVTDRAIEELIILDYTIQSAGIRRVSFLLPASMKRAKISTPPLQQITRTPVGGQSDALRVTLELQGKVLDQLRVLVENDRQWTAGPQTVPIPKVENAEVNRQYATLESAGRDELVVGKPDGLTKLQPEQAEWKTLQKILPRQMTHAYLVTGSAAAPKLTFQSKVRTAVQVVGAWIGLVETVLVLDDNGAYRAQQTYHVRNATEQYLEIELPPGAALWTARAAGAPVRPVKSAAADPRNALIPLVTSVEGDLPYPVVLCYGGKLDALKNLREVDFPLARSVDVQPELSLVRLYLPEDRRWLHFGGTMRHVEDEAEMTTLNLQYQTKVFENLRQSALQGNEYTRQRAAVSLQQQLYLNKQVRQKAEEQTYDAGVRKSLSTNDAAVERAQQDIAHYAYTPQEASAEDNPQLLRRYYEGQYNRYSGTTLNRLGGNFEAGSLVAPSDEKAGKGVQFNAGWLKANAPARGVPPPQAAPQSPKGDRKEDLSRLQKKVADLPSAKPSAARVELKQLVEEINLRDKLAAAKKERLNEEKNIQRYREQFMRRQSAQLGEALLPYNNDESQSGRQMGPSSLGASTVRGFQTLGRNYKRSRYSSGEEESAPTTALPPPPSERPVSEAAGSPETGLVSLDFTLPSEEQIARSQVYRFTTPRGETKITARSLATDFSRRVISLVAALAALLVLIVLLRSVRGSRGQWIAHHGTTTVMIVLGLLSVITGALPVVGLLLLLAGLALKIRRRIPAAAPAG